MKLTFNGLNKEDINKLYKLQALYGYIGYYLKIKSQRKEAIDLDIASKLLDQLLELNSFYIDLWKENKVPITTLNSEEIVEEARIQIQNITKESIPKEPYRPE